VPGRTRTNGRISRLRRRPAHITRDSGLDTFRLPINRLEAPEAPSTQRDDFVIGHSFIVSFQIEEKEVSPVRSHELNSVFATNGSAIARGKLLAIHCQRSVN